MSNETERVNLARTGPGNMRATRRLAALTVLIIATLLLSSVLVMEVRGASATSSASRSTYSFTGVSDLSYNQDNGTLVFTAPSASSASQSTSTISSTVASTQSTTTTFITTATFMGEYYWVGTDLTHLPAAAWNEPQPFYSAQDAINWAVASLPSCTGYVVGVWTSPEGNLGNVAGEITPGSCSATTTTTTTTTSTTSTSNHNLIGVTGASGQEPSVVVSNGVYYMAYDVNSPGGTWTTYVADSNDGLAWTNSTLILTGYNNENVIQAGNQFYLFANSALTQNAIYEWQSSNMWNWTPMNGAQPVLTAGLPGSWDSLQIHNTGAYYNTTSKTFTILFDGDNGQSIYSSIGLAYQTTQGGPFTVSASPVIVGAGTGMPATGGFLAWGAPSNLVYQNGTWYVLANAEETTSTFGVYLLSSPNLETWNVVGLVIPGATDPFVVFTSTGASVYMTDSGIRFLDFSSQSPLMWLW